MRPSINGNPNTQHKVEEASQHDMRERGERLRRAVANREAAEFRILTAHLTKHGMAVEPNRFKSPRTNGGK